MMNKQPTQQEIEQAKSDPLYIALILRQRVRNAEAIRNDTMIRMGRDPADLLEPPTVALTVNEADILLKHFSSQAEKMSDLSRQLESVRKTGEVWMRDANHANGLLGRVMHLFARDQWQVEKQEDQAWMIHTPRADGAASHTLAWTDSADPAEALLALILDAVIETGRAGYESPTLADALEGLGKNGGDVNEKPSTEK